MPDGVPSFEKFDAKKKEKYLKSLRGGNRRVFAARQSGVSHSLICLYRNANSEFAEAEREAEDESTAVIECALHKLAREGNVTAIQVWLYNRAPDRWKDKRSQTVILRKRPEDFTDEDLALLAGGSSSGAVEAPASASDQEQPGNSAVPPVV
jgi:hypothetical protein